MKQESSSSMVNEAEDWYTGPANELTSAGVGSPLKPESSYTKIWVFVAEVRMAVIPSPSHAQQTLPSHTAYEDFAGPSNQTSQPSQGPSNRLQRGTTPVGGIASLPNGQIRRINGYAMDLAGTHPNGELPEQTLSRSRTADNETLAHRPKPQLTRRRTDYERDRQSAFAAEETGELRHGWEDQYNSSEFLGLLSSVGL